MKRLLLVLAFVLAAAVPSRAATYYVAATGGDDLRSCGTAATIGTPRHTITGGIACLSPGDTLLVRTGTYDENLTDTAVAGSAGNYVRIAAYPGETVWMAPTSYGNGYIIYFASTQAYVEFDGINLDGTGRASNSMVNITAWSGGNAHHIRFKNAEVILGVDGITNQGTNSGAFGFLIVNDLIGSIGGNEFTNLTIHGGGDPGDLAYAFYIQGHDNVVDGCDMYDQQGYGIQIYNANAGGRPLRNVIKNSRIHDGTRHVAGFSGGGILQAGGDTQIYNNVIYGMRNPAGAFGIDLYSSNAADTLIYNNTIYDNTDYGILIETGPTDAIVRNNISYGNGNNYSDGGTGTAQSDNLFGTDPVFTNTAAFDFSLQAGSPAIDTGATLALVDVDIDGNARPFNLIYDKGAYEFTGAPTPPRTFYLSTAGNDSNDCTAATSIGTPKRTWNDLIADCGLGADDTVLIRAGTYDERLNDPAIAGSSGHRLTFSAYPGSCALSVCEVVTLRPTTITTGQIIKFSADQSYITFDGIDLDASGTVADSAVNIEASNTGDPHDLQFLNGTCTIGNSGGTNEPYCFAFADSKTGGATGQSLVQYWDISYEGGDAGDITYCALISSRHITVRDVDCHDTQGYGILIFNGAGDDPAFNLLDRVRVRDVSYVSGNNTHGVLIHGSDSECWNCLIYNIADDNDLAVGLDIYQSNFRTHIYNSDFYNIDGRPIHAWSFSGNAVITNNILFGNVDDTIDDESSGGIGTTTTNLIGVDPTWVNAPAGNFHITAGAARNTGTTVAAVTVDIAGTGRPQQGTYDIGAYEFSVGVVTHPSRLLMLFGSQ